MDVTKIIEEECNDIMSMLQLKNQSYGNSAINPLRIFSRADSIEQLNVRIDDKLSRIANGNSFNNEDTELDLIGYLILKRVARRFLDDRSHYSNTGVSDIHMREQSMRRAINDVLENHRQRCNSSCKGDGICTGLSGDVDNEGAEGSNTTTDQVSCCSVCGQEYSDCVCDKPNLWP